MNKIKCKSCESELLANFFNEQSGENCVLCASSGITLEKVEKSKDYEVVEDLSCAGGACTL